MEFIPVTVLPEIVLVPLDKVDEDFLTGVKRSLYRNYRRSLLVLNDFFFKKDQGSGKSVESYVSSILPRIIDMATRDPEIVLIVTNQEPGHEFKPRIVINAKGPRLIYFPFYGFPDTNSRVRGVVHTLGHNYGLSACYFPGCIMNPWSASELDMDHGDEPCLCPECGQGSR